MDPSLKERLVLRVNELHHDLEEAEYGEVNERMFGSEWQRWKECFNLHFCKKMRIMELGVGTGFVWARAIHSNSRSFLRRKDDRFPSLTALLTPSS